MNGVDAGSRAGAVLDPAHARPRPDLAFLRHRALPAALPSVVPLPPVSLPSVAPLPPAAGRSPLPPLLPGFRPVAPGERIVLDDDTPVVQLSRVQSGVGGLRVAFETALPAAVAILYELRGGQGALRGPDAGFAPDHRRPVVSLSGLAVQLDLRQVRALGRFLVAVRAPRVDGVLVVETAGGARLEVPLRTDDGDRRPSSGAGGSAPDLVALSGYRVRGALVLRAEDQLVTGGLRAVATAYGYRELTWRDPDTPLD